MHLPLSCVPALYNLLKMTSSKELCDLTSCYFCQNCEKDWVAAIGANRKNLLYKKGDLIFNEGDPVKGMFFVYKGRVKVHKKWGDKELILRFADHGAILGHRGLGGDDNIYPISATALEPTTVCYIDLAFFFSSLKVNHVLAFDLIMFYAEELKESEKRMRNMAHMSVKGRLAYALLLLSKKFGTRDNGSVAINLSRQDLASYVGASYETVLRTLNEMVSEKMVELRGKEIHIKNEVSLVHLSQDN